MLFIVLAYIEQQILLIRLAFEIPGSKYSTGNRTSE